MKQPMLTGPAAAVALGLFATAATAQSSPSAFTSAMRYDLEHRVVGTIAPDPDGSGSLASAATRNTYDAQGRLTKAEIGELSSWQSEATAPASWTGYTVASWTDYSYDADGRKIREATSSGAGTFNVTQSSYDTMDRVRCIAVRMNPAAFSSAPSDACALGTQGSAGPDRIMRNTYDGSGNVAKIERAVGTSIQQDYANYTYDARHQIVTVKDANGNLAQFGYDVFGRKTKWYFPSKTSAGQVSSTDYEEYTPDANGNLTGIRKRDGRWLNFGYDALNRMTWKVVPDGCAPIQVGACPPAAATRDVYYGYDLRGLQLFARFDSASGEGVSFAYDALGRLASATETMGAVTRSIGSTYNADGARTRLSHPDGAYFDQTIDGLDRVTNASWWIAATGTVPFFGITYDARGLRWGTARASSSTWQGYDGAARLVGVQQYFAGGAGDMLISINRNAASQIVSTSLSTDGYAFTGAAAVSRSYAVNGLNQYTAAGPAAFTYDANGNLTSDGSNGYTYDAENRLVAGGPFAATLTYDPLGRLWQVSSTTFGKTQFVHDGDQTAIEYDGDTGSIRRRFYWGPGIDEPVMQDEGGTLNCSGSKFLHPNHQGSIIAVADCWGTRTNVDAYDEWGIPNSGNWGRYQYTGQAWLPELGMLYYKARIYSPTLGRFMQTDPVGYTDQVNLYAYVANDPVNGRDPSGKERCQGTDSDCAKVAAGAEKTREMALKTAPGSELRKTAGSIGEPGKGALIIAKPEIQDTGNFDAEAAKGGAVVLGSNTLDASADLMGGVIAHEVTHKRDYDDNGPLKTGKERLETERHSYGVENEYRKAQGWGPRPNGVEKDAQRSFEKSCAATPTHPSCN